MAKKTKKRTQVLGSERAAKASEMEAVRMISGGEIPTEETVVEQPVVGTPRGLPRGIAGTEVITDETGKERLVYTTKPGEEKVDVVFGTPAPIRTKVTSPSGAGGGDGGPLPITFTASDGTEFTDQQAYVEYEASLQGKRSSRQSAFDLLYEEFSRYGMGSLVEPLRQFILDPSVSPSEFSIKLRETKPYQTRFAANQKRINRGLRAISEAEYLELEDQYQNIMRRYGLPASYYTKGDLGRQEGFEKFIEQDVAPTELEERISIAQERLNNAPPEVMRLLSDYYAGIINNGDALAYVLNPEQAISEIRRKVTAAEIGAGAAQAGLGTTRQRAEELQKFGITGAQAREGFQTVAELAPRGGQLAAIYGESPYTQQTAEEEVFGTAGAVEAKRKRERLSARERSAFSGTSGAFQGALSRDRQGAF